MSEVKELSVLRSLLQSEFFSNFYGRLPEGMFSKESEDIIKTLKYAHDKFGRDVSVHEAMELHNSLHPGRTPTQVSASDTIFTRLQGIKPVGPDIAQDILERVRHSKRIDDITNAAFEASNAPDNDDIFQNLLDKVKVAEAAHEVSGDDDFMPVEMDAKIILSEPEHRFKWSFNIGSLAEYVPGMSPGYFMMYAALVNCGKTSFHASLAASPEGFLWQGAKVLVVCTEEAPVRVRNRYMTCASGLEWEQQKEQQDYTDTIWDKIRHNLTVVGGHGRSIHEVDKHCANNDYDVIVVDVLDKLLIRGDFAGSHERLGSLYQHFRDMCVERDMLGIGFSQLSADAIGTTSPTQHNLKDSRISKAGEGDLIILGAKKEGMGGEDNGVRYLNIGKNKLTGVEGKIVTKFNIFTGRYEE